MTRVRSESSADQAAIHDVHTAAFETAAEADLVDALRDGGFVAVSLVAEENGEVVGHILFHSILIREGQTAVGALSLAPMAVAPTHQRRGIGSTLVEAGLEACRHQGYEIVVVLGHPAFYPRFGFSSVLAQSLRSPFGGGDAWMATELVAGALNSVRGVVEYPPPFQAL